MTEEASIENENYWLVRFTLREVRAFNGSVLTKEGSFGYPVISDGYPQICKSSNGSFGGRKFSEKPDIKLLEKWDGMPWYCRISSCDVINVVRKVTKTVSESRSDVVTIS